MGNPNSAVLISDGWLHRQEKAKWGLELPANVSGGDGIGRDRQIVRSERVFIARNGIDRTVVSTAAKYYPLVNPNGCKDHVSEARPDDEGPPPPLEEACFPSPPCNYRRSR